MKELLKALRTLPEYVQTEDLFSSDMTRIACGQHWENIEINALFTMFVLAWPSAHCGNTCGAYLRLQIANVLANAPECLKSEVGLLQKQLNIVYDYYLLAHESSA